MPIHREVVFFDCYANISTVILDHFQSFKRTVPSEFKEQNMEIACNDTLSDWWHSCHKPTNVVGTERLISLHIDIVHSRNLVVSFWTQFSLFLSHCDQYHNKLHHDKSLWYIKEGDHVTFSRNSVSSCSVIDCILKIVHLWYMCC